MYTYLSSTEKIALINRLLGGESVTRLSREAGVSRTIIYRWLTQYKKTKHNADSLQSKRPKGSKHWRFAKSSRQLALSITLAHPEFSVHTVARELSRQLGKKSLSSYAIYRIFKQLDLTTYSQRFAFAKQYKLDKGLRSHVLASVAVLPQERGYLSAFLPVLRKQSVAPRIQWAILIVLSVWCIYSLSMTISVGVPLLARFITHQGMVLRQIAALQAQNKLAIAPVVPQQDVAKMQRAREFSDQAQQDLSWGVLSANLDKASYRQNEPIKLSFGVLDEKGATVCDANLIATITSPTNRREVLSIHNGNIQLQNDCFRTDAQALSDYVGVYTAGEVGWHDINVIAETKNGTKVITGGFEADKIEKPITITHDIPTRIYPPTTYPAVFTIRARKNFRGTVSQRIPQSFMITQLSGVMPMQAVNAKGSEQIVSWNVNFQAGEEAKIGYQFKAPYISPAVYVLSPLTFTDEYNSVIQEGTAWSIASDH